MKCIKESQVFNHQSKCSGLFLRKKEPAEEWEQTILASATEDSMKECDGNDVNDMTDYCSDFSNMEFFG